MATKSLSTQGCREREKGKNLKSGIRVIMLGRERQDGHRIRKGPYRNA